MVAYNFKKQFADDVEYGTKRQTVRAERKDNRHAKPGDNLQLFTGMRTKGCRKLRDAICSRVQKIRIEATEMFIDGERLQAGSGNQFADPDNFDNDFAKADGFDEFMDMSEWFSDTHGLPFEGVLIKWN